MTSHYPPYKVTLVSTDDQLRTRTNLLIRSVPNNRNPGKPAFWIKIYEGQFSIKEHIVGKEYAPMKDKANRDNTLFQLVYRTDTGQITVESNRARICPQCSTVEAEEAPPYMVEGKKRCGSFLEGRNEQGQRNRCMFPIKESTEYTARFEEVNPLIRQMVGERLVDAIHRLSVHWGKTQHHPNWVMTPNPRDQKASEYVQSGEVTMIVNRLNKIVDGQEKTKENNVERSLTLHDLMRSQPQARGEQGDESKSSEESQKTMNETQGPRGED